MAARKGDYPHREAKKPKKGAKPGKSLGSIVPTPPPTVEVIKKKRNPKGGEESE